MPRWIDIRTELPGPRSRAIIERKQRAVANAIGLHAPAVIERAEGALITDVDGNTFIDLAGGLGVLNVGHANPAVVRAAAAQAERFTHTDFSVVPYECYVELAERLCALVPGQGPKKAALFNSGAEAVENAVKFAKAYTGRRAVIAFEGAFHGRTLLALSLTSKVKPYKEGLGPFAPEVYRLPFPNPYRRAPHASAEEHGVACAEAVQRAFRTAVAASDVAAVIVEPVLGEGGFVVPPEAFLRRLREICTRHGVLLIADEVQTGFGRTGAMFALEHFGIEADLVCLAKSIAGGFPLSAVVGRREVMDAPGEGAVGGTYVGNPVACAAALAVLDEMERLDLPSRAAALGRRMQQRFRSWQSRYAIVGDVRGLGAMMAIELVSDSRSREPAPDAAGRIVRRCLEGGVIVVTAGVDRNVIRVLAPLVITDEQLDEALDVMERAIAAESPTGDGRESPKRVDAAALPAAQNGGRPLPEQGRLPGAGG